MARKPRLERLCERREPRFHARREPREAARGSPAFEAGRLGRKYPVVINGRKISDRPFLPSVNPAHPDQVVGYWAKGTIADADAAVAAGVAYFPKWRATPVDERSPDARAGGRPHGVAPPRAQFAPHSRGRQAVDGGRCRRLGGDRLLPLLRPGDAPARPAGRHPVRARRGLLPGLDTPGRGRFRGALEFSPGDPHRAHGRARWSRETA